MVQSQVAQGVCGISSYSSTTHPMLLLGQRTGKE
jgi:hypothetical protein